MSEKRTLMVLSRAVEYFFEKMGLNTLETEKTIMRTGMEDLFTHQEIFMMATD